MTTQSNRWRRRLLRVGTILVLVGAAPMLSFLVWNALVRHEEDPNPIGLGCFFWFVGGAGFLCLLIGISLDAPPKDGRD